MSDPRLLRPAIAAQACLASHAVRQRERYLTAQKRDVRRHAAPADHSSGGRIADGDVLAQCYAAVLSPSQEAIAAEDLQAMEAAFETLPEAYREVITLSRIARLSRAEVAARMQRTEASVRNLLPRALVALAEAIERHRSEAGG